MPDDSFVLLTAPWCSEKLDRLDEAMADLYRVIRTKPDQASRAYFAMMGIFEWRKMSAETLAATQIFLRYEPGNQSVLRDLPRKERNAQVQAAQGRVPTHMPLPPEQVARAAAQPAVVPVVAAPAPSAAKVPAGDTLQQKQAACQRGDFAACVRTGNAYEDGAGVQANPATAATWYRRACDGKDGDGCGRLGWLIFTGKGAPRNFEEGYALIEKGCDDLKSGEACYIASVVNYASDAEELRALGARKLMESCGNGYVEGCYEMSLNWLEGKNGFERDVVAGVVIMEEEACKKGHARACAVAGYEWEWNKELANDATRAVQLYRQACDAAAQLGCVYLGVAYGNGAGGLARDPARAAQLYTRACDGDVGGACSLLADAYRQGSGVARDASKADSLARKGCELKSPYCGQTAAAARGVADVRLPRHPLPLPLVHRKSRASPLAPMPAAIPAPMAGRSGSPAATTSRRRPAARSFISTSRTTVSIRRPRRRAPRFSSASGIAPWRRWSSERRDRSVSSNRRIPHATQTIPSNRGRADRHPGCRVGWLWRSVRARGVRRGRCSPEGAPSGMYESRLPDGSVLRLDFHGGGKVDFAMTEDGATNSFAGKWVQNGDVILAEGGEGMTLELRWQGKELITNSLGMQLTFARP